MIASAYRSRRVARILVGELADSRGTPAVSQDGCSALGGHMSRKLRANRSCGCMTVHVASPGGGCWRSSPPERASEVQLEEVEPWTQVVFFSLTDEDWY